MDPDQQVQELPLNRDLPGDNSLPSVYGDDRPPLDSMQFVELGSNTNSVKWCLTEQEREGSCGALRANPRFEVELTGERDGEGQRD
jgi:hypothetical protein